MNLPTDEIWSKAREDRQTRREPIRKLAERMEDQRLLIDSANEALAELRHLHHKLENLVIELNTMYTH